MRVRVNLNHLFILLIYLVSKTDGADGDSDGDGDGLAIGAIVPKTVGEAEACDEGLDLGEGDGLADGETTGELEIDGRAVGEVLLDEDSGVGVSPITGEGVGVETLINCEGASLVALAAIEPILSQTNPQIINSPSKTESLIKIERFIFSAVLPIQLK